MAVTKIWDVSRSFASPIAYIQNEEKTMNPKWSESKQMLEDVIEYAAQEDKTENKFFVSTLNCNKTYAREEFLIVKKRFDKEGGIVAYHGYQSFEEGEVTPAEAHDPSQRANGFLTLAGGIIITFTKEILALIVG